MSWFSRSRIPGKAFVKLGHPLQAREPALGYASRLAAIQGVDMARFLQDMRVNPRELGRGNEDAVQLLADLRALCAKQREALSRYTPWRRVGDHIPTVAGHRLLAGSVLHTSVRVCPHCVAEDLSDFQGPVFARPWLRLEWVVRHVRVCGRHGNLLIDIASPYPTHRTFDFHRTVAEQVIPELDRLREQVMPGPGTAFRDWLLNRIDGHCGPSNWLDDVPLKAAVAFCEWLGFSSVHGLDVKPSSLSSHEWATLAEEGFRIASQGKVAIDAALDLMVARRPSKRGFLGHEKAYGQLYLYLRRHGEDAGFEKLRAIVREHAFSNLPFDPGRTILGVTLEARRVHNQRTAAKSCSRADVFLKRLIDVGFIPRTENIEVPNGRLRIPVQDVDAIVARLGEYLTTKDVADRTGFDRRLVDALAENGRLRSLAPEERLVGVKYRFLRADVDALMLLLFRGAEAVDGPTGRRVSVAQARNKTRGFAADILSLILDGKLAWTGRHGDGGRYEHLLVDIDEVVGVMRSQSTMSGMYADDAAVLIPGIDGSNISRLAKAGYLSSTTEFCRRSMRTMTVLTRDSVEAFAAEYVSVAEIGRITGLHVKVVARRLQAGGVAVAIDREIPKTRVYRRSDVAACRVLETWPSAHS